MLREAGRDALLNASGLSAPARDLVRSSLGDSFEPDDVTAGIERVRAVLAKERDANVVQGIHPITAGDMQDGLDRFKLDFDWVMGGPGRADAGPAQPQFARSVSGADRRLRMAWEIRP